MSTRRTPSDTPAEPVNAPSGTGEGGDLSEITKAIAARQAQIKQLQADIDALRRAASVLGGKTTGKATDQLKTKSKRKQKGRGMSAAARKAVSRRMKAYWAARKK